MYLHDKLMLKTIYPPLSGITGHYGEFVDLAIFSENSDEGVY